MANKDSEIPVGHAANFHTLGRAIEGGDAFLFRAVEKSTNKLVTLVCVGNRECFVPFAKMLAGDIDQFEPLTPDPVCYRCHKEIEDQEVVLVPKGDEEPIKEGTPEGCVFRHMETLNFAFHMHCARQLKRVDGRTLVGS